MKGVCTMIALSDIAPKRLQVELWRGGVRLARNMSDDWGGITVLEAIQKTHPDSSGITEKNVRIEDFQPNNMDNGGCPYLRIVLR